MSVKNSGHEDLGEFPGCWLLNTLIHQYPGSDAFSFYWKRTVETVFETISALSHESSFDRSSFVSFMINWFKC